MWENINCFVVKLIYYVFILWCRDFFSTTLSRLCFHQFVSWFHGPGRMCICELWWKLSNSSAFDCKASVDIFEMSEPALSTHTTTKPRNNDTRLQLFNPDEGKERTNIRVSIQYLTWISSHIYISPCSRLAGWNFCLERTQKWCLFLICLFTLLSLWTKKSLKGLVCHFFYVKSSIHLTSTWWLIENLRPKEKNTVLKG